MQGAEARDVGFEQVLGGFDAETAVGLAVFLGGTFVEVEDGVVRAVAKVILLSTSRGRTSLVVDAEGRRFYTATAGLLPIK